MKQFTRHWCGLLLLSFSCTLPLHGQLSAFGMDEEQPVTADLVAESSHIQPGVPVRIGLLIKHQPKWHTYWINSATGYATTVEWDVPEGFSISELQWPTPSLYVFSGFTEYVYEGTTLVTATLYPPADLPEEWVEVGYTADWLMCEDVCIPGGSKGSLRLPVDQALPQPTEHADLFKTAEKEQPVTDHPYSLTARVEGRTVLLEVSGPQIPASAYFFDQDLLINPAAEATAVSQSSGTLTLTIPLAESTAEIPEKLSGVLKADDGWPALEGRPGLAVNVPLTAASTTSNTAIPSWPVTLLLAFVGGMILNLMPCVFPVLGIKIMGFVNQAGESRSKIVMHGLVFTAGVILSFWALTTFLLVLRSSGNQLGWGFQLQSPAFVLALALILFGFGLNMSGLF